MDKKLSTGIQVALGFLLGIVLNVVVVRVAIPLAMGLLQATGLRESRGLDTIWIYGLGFIGAGQLIWQLPLILLLRRKEHKGLALGVILAASLTALLNATCWGLFWSGKMKIGG